jgi:small subunit ribosomal protein S9
MAQKQYYYANGKRKTSVARVRLYAKGEGNMEINGKSAKEYLTVSTLLGTIKEPLKVLNLDKDFDITIRVVGGGTRGQADAMRHGIAKALLEYDPLLRPQLKKLGFLTRDSRKVERKKPGLKKARKAPQWAKR